MSPCLHVPGVLAEGASAEDLIDLSEPDRKRKKARAAKGAAAGRRRR